MERPNLYGIVSSSVHFSYCYGIGSAKLSNGGFSPPALYFSTVPLKKVKTIDNKPSWDYVSIVHQILHITFLTCFPVELTGGN